MDVISRIEQYRKEKGWTVYKLALEAGLSQSTLANMYARGTLPSLTSLENICDAFGITLSQFFSENERKIELSQEEVELIRAYRRMSPDNKKLVVSLTQKIR